LGFLVIVQRCSKAVVELVFSLTPPAVKNSRSYFIEEARAIRENDNLSKKIKDTQTGGGEGGRFYFFVNVFHIFDLLV